MQDDLMHSCKLLFRKTQWHSASREEACTNIGGNSGARERSEPFATHPIKNKALSPYTCTQGLQALGQTVANS